MLRPIASQAQILDDSTRTLYGPKTTLILREADILRENYKGVMVDTSITNLQQQRYWTHDSTYQQDLGNMGTASRPLLWQFNTQIGARLGRDVFSRYSRDATTIPYYDTRSPYTFIRYLQSGIGEQVFEISYTRSLGKNFNVGVAYERIAGNQVFGSPTRKRGLTEQSNVLLFMRYQTEDDRYHLVANFGTSRYQAAEQGGIRRLPTDTTWFGYRRANVWLTQAENRDDRDQLHFTHTYKLLGRGLTAFHTFDWRRQTIKYTDASPDDTTSFYPIRRFNFARNDDRADYRQVENTVGVLGHSNAVDYRLYARSRNGRLTTRSLVPNVLLTDSLAQVVPDRKFNQVFLGGTAAFHYKIFAIQTAGEFLPLGTIGNSALGEYWFRGIARVGPLSGEFASSSYAPTLTQEEFFGAHYNWNHRSSETERFGNRFTGTFDNTNVQQLAGRVDQTLGTHRLEGSVTAVTINNLVYYDRNSLPQQLTDTKQLLIVGVRHRFHIGKIYTDNEGTYTAGGDGEGLRIPALVTNSRVYYQGSILKNVLFGQVGAEVYYQSRFRGYEYNPNIQQFYVQDHFTIRNYALVDVFLNADIKTVGFFLKMAYVNQGIYQDGYFTTPYYTGLPRRFQFGIRWQFFN